MAATKTAKTTKRLRYNRANLTSTMHAAMMASDEGGPKYVFCTAYGYTIENEAPAFGQQHYRVQGDKIVFVPDRGAARRQAEAGQ
jgi:hypothetical protein